ncbi:tyrosine-type recombinase/integrase [Bacillus sp. T33-2]|uniref:tyrosine-type recombinase/integrase n=1 Tax=Bacillus sp. T33-2 TaxID=2054168 RepID=UPI000C763C1E|nr:tyrosine-type recombinase/integrase [Bacillus sp. T33-2]PLR99649.1 integrase [Bacillus sp. T33-2]
MAKSKITRVKYFTDEKKALINPENQKKYDKYLNSNIIKNRDVKDTTYKVYQNYMSHFLVYLAENWNNIDLYCEDFMENAVDIMEGYISFCQDVLKNNKKAINTKLSTVSSFYLWSLKRKYIDRHPFDKQLDRMKGANEEKIINSYYLDEDQMNLITEALKEESKKYDIQDRLIWGIMLDSANRVGAISNLTLSSLDLDNMLFEDIREKRGYRVEVVYEEDTKELIEQWLEQRKEMDNLKVDSLFITRYQGVYRPMTKSTIQERVKKIGEILGLEDFHAHCIRKTKLNDVYRSTGDLALAASLGNHKSVETTRSAYIKPQSKSEIREKIAQLRKQKKKVEE